MDATVGKRMDDAMSNWAKRPDVKDLSQLEEAINALALEPLEQEFATRKFTDLTEKAESAGKSDKWPDNHPAVPEITEKADFHLYIAAVKIIYLSELNKMKPLVSTTAMDLTTFGNQLKHTYSHIPRTVRDVLLVPPTLATQLGKMAAVRRMLNQFSGEPVIPLWSADPRLWPNHDWLEYALCCVNSQSSNTKGISTGSANQREQLEVLARGAVDSFTEKNKNRFGFFFSL
jgi:hypothetical protein